MQLTLLIAQLAMFLIDAQANRSTVKGCIVFTFIFCVVRIMLNERTRKSVVLLENSKKCVKIF